MRYLGKLAAGAAAALMLAGCGSTVAGSAGSDSGPMPSVPTVLILDASGSMTEAEGSGERMDAAKLAARTLVDALPADAELALLAYGASTGGAEEEKARGCADVTTLVPLGPLDRGAMAGAIDALTPSGYTPIGLSLERAAEQLEGDGEQAIVLVSDGEDTCDMPPCEVAARIRDQHPQTRISTIGFRTEGEASRQLSCVADVGDGLFVTADNAEQLAARLLASRDLAGARLALSPTGSRGLILGKTAADLRAENSDLPVVAESGEVVIFWRDCDLTFVDGVLTAIAPRDGGRTIDGVGPGAPVSKAIALYGEPLTTTRTAGGAVTLLFPADPATGAGYEITTEDADDSVVDIVTLCRCLPGAGTGGVEHLGVAPVDAAGNPGSGWQVRDETRSAAMCFGGYTTDAQGAKIYDCGPAQLTLPCWASRGGQEVLCLTDVFDKTLTRWKVYGTLPTDAAPAAAQRPVAFTTADGTRCDRTSSWLGVIPNTAGMSIGGYTCGPDAATRASTDTRLLNWSSTGFGAASLGDPEAPATTIGPMSGPLTEHQIVTLYYAGAR